MLNFKFVNDNKEYRILATFKHNKKLYIIYTHNDNTINISILKNGKMNKNLNLLKMFTMSYYLISIIVKTL